MHPLARLNYSPQDTMTGLSFRGPGRIGVANDIATSPMTG
jgi:hypothetical protein